VRRVARAELLDFQTWGDKKAELAPPILAAKHVRRVHVGGYLTFLFENADTIRYQVQEMMRAEGIARETDIQRELDTYNELLGGEGELGCTLLIEIDDPDERARRLRAWIDLPEHVYLRLEDAARVRPRIDERQRSDRLSTVQYLKFDTGGRTPVAVGCDHPDLAAETVLDAAQRGALAEDMAS
jgi:Protein of unknown function (DUF3501)